MPSYREGLPLFLLEAGAYGKVSVASDVSGCNSVIKNNVNGLLVPAKDSKALEVALDQLIASPQLRYKMGMTSRKIVEENFDSKQLLNKYLNLYK